MEEKSWYAVHTYSGYENKVKTNLEKRIESMNMEDYIFRIMIPTEDVEEKKNDKVKINKRKVFPGYVLVEMIMTDDSWYVVRNVHGCTGFVGPASKPVPLTDEEVRRLVLRVAAEELEHSRLDEHRRETVFIRHSPAEGEHFGLGIGDRGAELDVKAHRARRHFLIFGVGVEFGEPYNLFGIYAFTVDNCTYLSVTSACIKADTATVKVSAERSS